MKKIIIYTSTYCSYCITAKNLLENENLIFEEKNVDLEPTFKLEMISRANGSKTVPQIFIDNEHIGGCDDLLDLHQSGTLRKKFL